VVETSIVILNWKLPELTQKTIDSITKNTSGSYNIIVVEQENKIENLNYTPNPNLNFIVNESNLGVPKAYNQGVQLAMNFDPKYIVIMNNDVEVLPRWLDELKRCAESDPKIGIVGGKALHYGENPTHPDHFGIIVFTDGYITGKQIEVPAGSPDLNLDIENYCVGFACALIKTEVFKEVGMFDENYSPCDYEDTDLCFAARAKGWKVMSCIASKYYHLEGATFKEHKQSLNLLEVFDRNQKYFAQKWKNML
jgi:GT2 family glycosyltransferase